MHGAAAADLRQLVVSFQIHGFSVNDDPLSYQRVHSKTCSKKGTTCRFYFPFILHDETDILPDGSVIAKRNHPWVAPYNPWILQGVRYNHNVQLLGSGSEAYAAIAYTVAYSTKTQQEYPAILTTLAKMIANPYSVKSIDSATGWENRMFRLMVKGAHALNGGTTRSAVLAATEVKTFVDRCFVCGSTLLN